MPVINPPSFISCEKMSEAKVVQKFPFKTHVEKGKSYYWCKCGLSSKQPFCDGSHETTDFLPSDLNENKIKQVSVIPETPKKQVLTENLENLCKNLENENTDLK